MKNILITGGAGFIGSNLSLRLVEKGYNVTVLDNLSPQIHGSNPESTSPLYRSILNHVKFINGSVTSRNDWLKSIDGQDAIIHLAAETGTGQSMCEIEKYVQVNIGGTALMLDILTNMHHSIKKVIVASSRAIYGEGKYLNEKGEDVYPSQRTEEFMSKGDFAVKDSTGNKQLTLVGTDEKSKINPTSVYGITKQNQEQLVMTICPNIGIAPVAFRYQNVYGPGQSLSNPYTGILSIFSTRLKNGNDINIFEDGKESRDFVFIDDVVDATILGLEKEDANNQVFNVGSGIPTDVLTVAKELMKNYNVNVSLNVSGDYRLGDIRHNYADLNKVNKYLGFVPKINFTQGIKLFTDWVNGQKVQSDNYDQSIIELKDKGFYKTTEKNFLAGKKILFIAPKFYGYEQDIIAEMKSFGAIVTFFPEKLNFFIYGLLNALNKKIRQQYDKFYLNKIINKTDNNYFDYIFLLRAAPVTPEFMLKIKKKNPNAKCILYLWDSIKNNDKSNILNFFDNVFSFDINNVAANNNLKYLPLFYSKQFIRSAIVEKPIDLLFIGSIHSRRYEDVLSVKRYCELNNINFYYYLYIPFFSWLKFIIVHKKYYNLNDIRFKQLKKEKIVDLMNKSKVVLDLHNLNQSGLTIRTMEVLSVGAKLLTTNISIINHKIYNDDNIRILDIDNINIDKEFIESVVGQIDVSEYSITSWLRNIFI